MSMTQSFGDQDASALYQQSFGNLPNKTSYYNPHTQGAKSIAASKWKPADYREQFSKRMMEGAKAQSTTAGGPGTAGYAMIPVYVDPLVVDVSRKWTPAVELIPRVSNQGMYADYNNILSKGGGYTRAENTDLTDTDTTYDRFSTQIKFLYAVGAVTGQVQAAQPAYSLMGFQPGSANSSAFGDASAPNAKMMKVLEKTREIKELEENLIFNGNATTSGISGNPNGTEFDGIVTLMSTTNTVAKSTTALDLKDFNRSIRLAADKSGRPSLGFCSTAFYEDTQNLIQAKFGFMQAEKEVFWGFETLVLKTMVGDVPLVWSQYLSNSSGSKAAYFLDMTVVEMRVLQDLTYFDLAKTNDSDRFALKIYEALIIRNTSFCSSITGVL